MKMLPPGKVDIWTSRGSREILHTNARDLLQPAKEIPGHFVKVLQELSLAKFFRVIRNDRYRDTNLSHLTTVWKLTIRHAIMPCYE